MTAEGEEGLPCTFPDASYLLPLQVPRKQIPRNWITSRKPNFSTIYSTIQEILKRDVQLMTDDIRLTIDG